MKQYKHRTTFLGIVAFIIFTLSSLFAETITYTPFELHIPRINTDLKELKTLASSQKQFSSLLYKSAVFSPVKKQKAGLPDKTCRVTVRKKEWTTTRGLTRYVTEKISHTEFHVSVAVYDGNSNRAEYTSSFVTKSPAGISRGLSVEAEKVINHYRPLMKPVLPSPIVIPPVPQTANVIHESDPLFRLQAWQLSAAFVQPLGTFRDHAASGTGIQGSAYVNMPVIKPITLKASPGIYWMTRTGAHIHSMFMADISLSALYEYSLSRYFSLAPYAGTGYFFARTMVDSDGKDVSGEYSYEPDYLYNPLFTLGMEFRYSLYGYNFSLTPAYTIFIEKNGTRSYATVMLGLVYLY
ncbi:MAG: hypothetical protein ACOCWZ_12160 [Spirochaetota bacterium]